MRITREQQRILERYKCERLSSDEINRELIKSFQSDRGENIVHYLQNNAWDNDRHGIDAVYLIKDPDGIPCVFFALKCGVLYSPLDEEAVRNNYELARDCLDILFDINNNSTERQALIKVLENYRQKQGISVEETLNKIIKGATVQKQRNNTMLWLLHDDRILEGNRPIQRVEHSYAGVEITHFCTNDHAREKWKKYGFRFPLGEVMFWKYIVPVFEKVQEQVGCQYAFLFAADSTEDGTLINYYEIDLKFSKLDDLGTIKPSYDWSCVFMSQEVSQMIRNREDFFENFNLDPGVEIV